MLRTIFNILTITATKEAFIEYAVEKELLYKQPLCGQCRNKTNRYDTQWHCSKMKCHWKKSIFKDSIFGRTHLKPAEVFLLGYLWLAKTPNSVIETLTGHSSATVTQFTRLFRQMVADEVKDEPGVIIGGDGVIVEIDESKFGKRKYNKGRPVEGAWVVGGVERTGNRERKGRMFAEVVERRDAPTLLEIIRRRVAPGSIIYTDLWRGYNAIPSLGDLEHQTVNHSQHFVDPETGVHTNTIEATWNGLKIGVPVRARNRNHLQNYLFEFMWRRQNEDDLWSAWLRCLANSAIY
jgi:transposase-like protein